MPHSVLTPPDVRALVPDLLSSHATVWVYRYRHPRHGWVLSIATHAELSATRDAFLLRARLDAWEGETPVARRRWQQRIPRDGV